MSDFYSEIMVLAVVGLSFAVVSDAFQILAKYAGRKSGRVAAGYNSAMKVMMLNRVGAVVYFFLVALSVDLGITGSEMLAKYYFGLILMALILLSAVILFLKKENISKTEKHLWKSLLSNKIGAASGIVSMVNTSALIFPFVASSYYPEFRLTLANSGFLLNSIGTLVNVFYIESKLASLIDSNDNSLGVIVASVLLFKVLGLLLMAIGVAVV